MAYGLNKNLLPKGVVNNIYESWNMNAVQDSSNNKNSLTSHSSYFDKKDNQNNVRYSTTILPSRLYPSTSQRPSTCASVRIIHSTASLPCRPSTANNCTRFHDNMLKALMRNIDKYCGKDGTNENVLNTPSTTVKQERDKKKKTLESNTIVDIDKFIKHHQKINETVENTDNIRKNAKPVVNKRKKSKSNTGKRGFLNETTIIGSKTSVNVQSNLLNNVNSHLKDDKIKDTVNEDAAWEVTDSDQIRNLVMPKETRNATLTLLNERKFKESKNFTYRSNNNILRNATPGMRKMINPSIKPLTKGGKSSARDVGKFLVNDFQALNVCPHNLLCDGKNCNHRMNGKKLVSTYSQPHLQKNVLI